MFKRKPKTDTTTQDLIDTAKSQLFVHDADSKEYDDILNQIERLHKLLLKDKEASISPDVVLTVAANLLGILLILNHERLNVVTSKAMSFVIKAKA